MVPLTHGSLRRGAGRGEHGRVIHRTRRVPPALPARRGMLAPWFRGRGADDGRRTVPPAPPASPAGPRATDPAEPDAGGAAPEPVRSPSVAVARVAYGQRVF